MKKIFVLILGSILGLTVPDKEIKIAAAGNLNFVLTEIKALYLKKNPENKVHVVFGSSGNFYQQIMNGANFDFFMSADKDFPVKLKKEGMGVGEVRTYAFGKLALWSNSIDVSKGMKTLTDPKVQHIAVAQPSTAPYGKAAIEVLKYYGIYDKVKQKLVFGESVSQAAQMVVSGNAEIGIIALSQAISPEMKNGSYFEISPKSYSPVEQACLVIKGNNNPEAEKFKMFILSNNCRAIFEKYGYNVP